jgi:hypothetical protein
MLGGRTVVGRIDGVVVRAVSSAVGGVGRHNGGSEYRFARYLTVVDSSTVFQDEETEGEDDYAAQIDELPDSRTDSSNRFRH